MYWAPSNSFSARTDEVDNHVAHLLFEQGDRVVHLHSSSSQASSLESPPFAPEHVLDVARSRQVCMKWMEATILFCQTAESFSEGNAVLLIYLVEEEKDIYILLAFALLCWRRSVSPHWRRPVASLAIMSPMLRSRRRLHRPSGFANSVADRSGLAYGMSNEAYLPPTFAIAWTPIRISDTSRISMTMGNRKTTARVGPSITPRRCTSMRALTSKNLPTSPRARRRPSQSFQYR
jgi:hypothetical protein